MGKGRIVVAEDDDGLRRAIAGMLRREGYDVADFAHGHDLPAMLAFRADLAVLDVMLPGCDGFTLAKHLLTEPATKVLFLTARSALEDCLSGFDAGAEDYVVKPVPLPELLARVQVVLRRRQVDAIERLVIGDLDIDLDATIAAQAGVPLKLTATEFKLLTYFAQHPGRTLTKLQLLTHVWGYDSFDPNVVEVYVSTLRRKFDPDGPNYITTVRGVGYRFDRPAP